MESFRLTLLLAAGIGCAHAQPAPRPGAGGPIVPPGAGGGSVTSGAISAAGGVLGANNLSDVGNPSAALANLGGATIGTASGTARDAAAAITAEGAAQSTANAAVPSNGGELYLTNLTPIWGTISRSMDLASRDDFNVCQVAKCDGRRLTDVTTTASSAVISSASYSFVAGDVGKYVTCFGAVSSSATNGGYLNATISSVSGDWQRSPLAPPYRFPATRLAFSEPTTARRSRTLSRL